jgi:hypothetical protein
MSGDGQRRSLHNTQVVLVKQVVGIGMLCNYELPV